MDQLKQVLSEKLAEYSQTYVEMPLVLFDDAMEHVARICRVIDQPAGNALLVGVGGSGKQSLSRLASFISKMEVFQIMVNQHYDNSAFKADLQVDADKKRTEAERACLPRITQMTPCGAYSSRRSPHPHLPVQAHVYRERETCIDLSFSLYV